MCISIVHTFRVYICAPWCSRRHEAGTRLCKGLDILYKTFFPTLISLRAWLHLMFTSTARVAPAALTPSFLPCLHHLPLAQGHSIIRLSCTASLQQTLSASAISHCPFTSRLRRLALSTTGSQPWSTPEPHFTKHSSTRPSQPNIPQRVACGDFVRWKTHLSIVCQLN